MSERDRPAELRKPVNGALEWLRKRPLVAIAGFFFIMGTMGTRPLVPLFSITLEIGPGEIGVLVAVYSFVPLLMAVAVGKWMDTHGTRNILLASAVIGGAGLIIPHVFPSREGMYLSQLITGSGWTVFILAAQKNIGGMENDAWSREKNVAVFSLGMALGSFFGPLIGGVMGDYIGYDWAFLTLGLIVLIAFFVLLPLPPVGITKVTHVPTPSSSNPLKIFGYHRYMGRAFLISSLILMAKDMYVAYFPLYAYALGVSASWVGIIIAIQNGGGVIMRVFLLPLVKTFGKNKVVVCSILFSGIFFLTIPFSESLVALTLVSLAIGLGLGLGQPLSITTTINLSPPDKVGEVLGFRLSCNRLTQVVTPLMFGGVVLFTGVAGTFWIIGLILTVGCMKLRIPAEEATVTPSDKS
ncbi:MFS transporter [Pelagibius sp.]|uniref:MFS transporter n=1 Tax=Pelagibius sp. TaxID=1931238 RepID=UPI003BB01E26